MARPLGLSDLSPWGARLCLRVERFLLSQCDVRARSGPLVLALSGGCDSTALAVVLRALSRRLGLKLLAAHLDHSLRPESPEDAAHCAGLCEGLGIPLDSARLDVAQLARDWRTGLEDAGRRSRYAWLEDIRRAHQAQAVLTAHQLDDLAEDALMRQVRGTGWPALAGMPAWDPSRNLLRPLLLTPRAHLERLLRELDIAWREDPSNAGCMFLRNRVRQDVLPALVRENPDYLDAVARLWTQAREDRAYWDALVEPLIARSRQEDGAVLLAAADLAGAPAALRLRLYKRAVEALGPGQPLSGCLRALDAAWQARHGGKRVQFPGGKAAQVSRNGVLFLPNPGAATLTQP